MLDSIPNREDIQIIVVDDCSDEDKITELQKSHHQNLSIYKEKQNLGAGHARNIGLSYATGKWVLVVDADDIFDPKAFDVFDQYIDSDIDYLCYVVDSLDNSLRPDGAWIRSSESIKAYCKEKSKENTLRLRYQNLICRNKMVSLSFIKKNNIKFEECQVNNDVYYGLAIGHLARKFVVLPNVLYHSIRSVGSITRKPRTIEREFLFYLQAQKRNGFYEAIGLKRWPYYRYDCLYIPFMIKKKGLKGAFQFFKYRKEHIEEVRASKNSYLPLLNYYK
jgi:glycosyltransferase involved in cell wall biosynthesis